MVVSERNRYAAVLAIVAVGILGVGYWLKPIPKPQSQRGEDVSVTRAELENLQQLVRRTACEISPPVSPMSQKIRFRMSWRSSHLP